MRSSAGSTAVVTAGAASTPNRHHPLQQEQTHDAKPTLQTLQAQHSQSLSPGHKQQQLIASSDSGDGDDGDDRSDVDGDDDGTGVRTGKRKRPISVSYV
ncbi:hypothetical protein SBRCBS47491_002568 [Sporothrix bragantina]|uniref:Uncharacterized protein n=1 Tax=Sporothrix bragantina TaxID=671064 RepID=A0ABP0B843_9PEZI